MADIKSFEKKRIEQLFQMGSGYVLDFSDRTFAEFVSESIGVNPYDKKYDLPLVSRSKANRLRGILAKEQNYKVGILLIDLAKYRSASNHETNDAESGFASTRVRNCVKIEV